jgi:hypothetical protein
MPRERHIAADAVLVDWKLNALERGEPRFHAGNQHVCGLVHRVDAQSLGPEQATDVGGQLEDDVVDLLRRVYSRRNRLQALEKAQATRDVARTRPCLEYLAHRSS